MSILITGNRGFVGKTLIKKLRGVTYAGLTEPITIDVLDKHQTADYNKYYDCIINCAAVIHPLSSSQSYKTNYKLVCDLLSKCNYGHFIQLGTSLETFCLENQTYYVQDKILATQKVLEYNQTVIRPYSLYGYHDRSTKLIPKVINKLHKNEDVIIYPGVHDWVYIDDFVDFIITNIIEKKHGVFDYCTGVATSNSYIVTKLRELLNSNSRLIRETESYRTYDSNDWVGTKPTEQGMINISKGLEKCVQDFMIELSK